MAGHSKWANIKRRKGAQDAVRGKIFTRLGKEIIVAARMGGGDPNGNPRLRTAIQAAKAASMPKDNIDRAIKRGTGELEGLTIEELTYEGYGPGGAAILVETATDNKNRTVADLRNIFKSNGGNLADAGSVAYLFSRHGQLVFNKSNYSEDQIMEVALEAGAQDVTSNDETVDVLTEPTDLYTVKDAFDKVGMETESTGFTYVASTQVPVEGENAEKLLKLMGKLEDHDDVQNVHSNFDIDDSVMAEIHKD